VSSLLKEGLLLLEQVREENKQMRQAFEHRKSNTAI